MDLYTFASLVFDGKDPRGFNTKYPNLYTELLQLTHFLQKSSKTYQRLWHVHENVFNVQECKICKSKKVSWNRSKKEYNEFCGTVCRNKDVAFIAHCKSKVFEKYGVNNVMQHPDVVEKYNNAIVLKYGSLSAYYKKQEETRKINNNHRYGVDNTWQLETVKSKIKQSNFDSCARDFHGQEHISLANMEILTSSEKLYELHHSNKKTITEIALLLGVNKTSVSKRFSQFNIPVLSLGSNKSIQELEMYDFVTKILPNHNIVQNNRELIHPYEVDVYIPKMRIAIEYNGLYWHSDKFKEKYYHYDKMQRLKKIGIRLITIFEDEWLHRNTQVKSKLRSILGVDDRPYIGARNTYCGLISNSETINNFFDEYHIQGKTPINASYVVGVYDDNDVIVGMGSFVKRKDVYELVRFATSIRVIGGFGKLMKWVKLNLKLGGIITFADKRWSNGQLYIKTNFELIGTIPPDYTYVEGNHRVHKFNYRHKKLSQKLSHYDSGLSEAQNTQNHNMLRIYNCGLDKYSIG